VRRVRRVAHQHDVPVVPAAIPNRWKIAPDGSVRQQPMTLELAREEALAEGQRLILIRLVEAGTPPTCRSPGSSI